MRKYITGILVYLIFLGMSFNSEKVDGQRLLKFILIDSLSKIDTIGTGSGNKYQKDDTLKIALKETAIFNKYQILFKYDSSGNANTQGKLPSIALDWGYLKTDRNVTVNLMPIIAIPGSSASHYSFSITDSITAYGEWVHYSISPDENEGIFLVVRNTDDDTSQVAYDRNIHYRLECNIR